MIILGGASRAGKGIISKALMSNLDIPFLSIDPIKMAISRAIPCYELNTYASSIEVCNQLWPFISALVKNLDETNVDYIVEGEILPKHVNELVCQSNCKISACFIGYKNLSITEKVAQIKANSGHPNDWTSDLLDSELEDLIKEGIEYSFYLEAECQKYGLQYIDFSADFDKAKQQVLEFLSDEFYRKKDS